MQVELTCKGVLITSGGAGMGRTTALAMAKPGADVFTCDIDADAMADLSGRIMRCMRR